MLRILTLPLQLAKGLYDAVFQHADVAVEQPVAAPARNASVAKSPAPKSPATTSGRVGKYDKPLTDLVAARPGITVAEAAGQLSVHPTALYPVIRRLEANGAIVKSGRELLPG